MSENSRTIVYPRPLGENTGEDLFGRTIVHPRPSVARDLIAKRLDLADYSVNEDIEEVLGNFMDSPIHNIDMLASTVKEGASLDDLPFFQYSLVHKKWYSLAHILEDDGSLGLGLYDIFDYECTSLDNDSFMHVPSYTVVDFILDKSLRLWPLTFGQIRKLDECNDKYITNIFSKYSPEVDGEDGSKLFREYTMDDTVSSYRQDQLDELYGYIEGINNLIKSNYPDFQILDTPPNRNQFFTGINRDSMTDGSTKFTMIGHGIMSIYRGPLLRSVDYTKLCRNLGQWAFDEYDNAGSNGSVLYNYNDRIRLRSYANGVLQAKVIELMPMCLEGVELDEVNPSVPVTNYNIDGIDESDLDASIRSTLISVSGGRALRVTTSTSTEAQNTLRNNGEYYEEYFKKLNMFAFNTPKLILDSIAEKKLNALAMSYESDANSILGSAIANVNINFLNTLKDLETDWVVHKARDILDSYEIGGASHVLVSRKPVICHGSQYNSDTEIDEVNYDSKYYYGHMVVRLNATKIFDVLLGGIAPITSQLEATHPHKNTYNGASFCLGNLGTRVIDTISGGKQELMKKYSMSGNFNSDNSVHENIISKAKEGADYSLLKDVPKEEMIADFSRLFAITDLKGYLNSILGLMAHVDYESPYITLDCDRLDDLSMSYINNYREDCEDWAEEMYDEGSTSFDSLLDGMPQSNIHSSYRNIYLPAIIKSKGQLECPDIDKYRYSIRYSEFNIYKNNNKMIEDEKQAIVGDNNEEA